MLPSSLPDGIAGNKKPASGRFFSRNPLACRSGHGPYVGIQPALVAGCLVLVDQALVGRAIDDRNSGLVGRHDRLLVTCFDGIDDLLDVSTQHAATAGVVLAALFRLAGALACLQ